MAGGACAAMMSVSCWLFGMMVVGCYGEMTRNVRSVSCKVAVLWGSRDIDRRERERENRETNGQTDRNTQTDRQADRQCLTQHVGAMLSLM